MGGPLDYIINQKTGMFVQPHSPHNIKNALYKLINDNRLYQDISQQGHVKGLEFSFLNMAKGYISTVNANSSETFRINPNKTFKLINDDGFALEYEHSKPLSDKKGNYNIKVYKERYPEEDVDSINNNYKQLQAIYFNSPNFIQPRRILLSLPDQQGLRRMMIISKRHDDEQIPLHNLNFIHDKNIYDQLSLVINTTKNYLINNDPGIDQFKLLPDISDNNLFADEKGQLKIRNIDNLINLQWLRHLERERKFLSFDKDIVYRDFFVNLIKLENEYLGKSLEDFLNDIIYNKFLSRTDIIRIYKQFVSNSPSVD